MRSPARDDVTGLGYQVEGYFRLPGTELLQHLVNFRFEGVFRVWPFPSDEFGNQVAKCFRVDAVPRYIDPILVNFRLSRLRTAIIRNHYYFG